MNSDELLLLTLNVMTTLQSGCLMGFNGTFNTLRLYWILQFITQADISASWATEEFVNASDE